MARAQLLCLIGAACLLIAMGGAAANAPPTLPEGWSGNCNSTVTVPFLGPTTLVGKCYFDGVGKRTRQDGTMSTPFGKVTAYDVHWWHETFDQCVALQGASDCTYMATSHIHSVDYHITPGPFGSGDSCYFTYKENKASPACTTDCQVYPDLQIPPFATFSTATWNGIPCDVWSWSIGSSGGIGKATWSIYVQSSSPTTIVHWTTHAETLGTAITTDVTVTDFDGTAPPDSVFALPAMKGCTLHRNNDDS